MACKIASKEKHRILASNLGVDNRLHHPNNKTWDAIKGHLEGNGTERYRIQKKNVFIQPTVSLWDSL